MNFNTPLFLFLFLPIFLIMYFLGQPRWRPLIGTVGSLIFYAGGQPASIPLMAGIILLNYWFGLRLRKDSPRGAFYLAIAVNVGLLVFFKVLTTYGLSPLGDAGSILPDRLSGWLKSLSFPLGLSYISFQVISYLVDVRREAVAPEKSLINFAFYVLLFPKLLAGPIVRYRTVADQLPAPSIEAEQIASGIRRFILGLAKKILIADVLAKVVNAVFVLPMDGISPLAAWLALISYALQIYYDFSGYADMAIGLASMLGLRFIENFNYPYVAQSVGEFWRRWHISLSSWFRDYVFFPLERRRLPVVGQPLNILIVFLLTGLWHGVTINFVVWGLLHGVFIALESLFLGRWLQKLYRPFRHVYALSVLLLTWLVFRVPDLANAGGFLRRLSGDTSGVIVLPFSETTPLPFLEPSFLLALAAGVVFALPVYPWLQAWLRRRLEGHPGWAGFVTASGDAVLLALLVLSAGMMTASRFLPAIYAGF
ncbi:MAG: MBOAT family O-acyltransferase [Bacteroidota bacterium]